MKEVPAVNEKEKLKKKNRNFKKRQKRKDRRTKRAAKKAIESGSVIVLVEEDVPLGAIAALGKGLGFVPTPKSNPLDERLEMRQNVNRVLAASHKQTSDQDFTPTLEPIPTQLRHSSYSQRLPVADRHVNTLIERLVTDHDSLLKNFETDKNLKSNLSKDERDGIKWLQDMAKKEKVSVVQADKGGAILLVTPELLRRKVLEKLENPQLYTKLDADPLKNLKKELFELWKKGKIEKYVSPKVAYAVAGVTENNNMSTLPMYKPGVPYFYPMLKIHKLRKEDLVPGVEPPARLVTALREGVAKRSDVYIADQFLKKLEKDFCQDLLVDSSDALRWLEKANSTLSPGTKKTIKCFTFDFKALYDSLDPELVKEAVMDAMNTVRPEWSEGLKNWLLSLIDFSLKASVARYENTWYKQKNGVPTGGSLCVQLANITVYYIMKKKVYSQPHMMRFVKAIKRYIDDGVGFFLGTEEEFKYWLRIVNANLAL